MMRTGVCTGTPSAPATSCGAVRSNMVLAVRMISPPIGSSRVLSPPIPSSWIRYSAGLAR